MTRVYFTLKARNFYGEEKRVDKNKRNSYLGWKLLNDQNQTIFWVSESLYFMRSQVESWEEV